MAEALFAARNVTMDVTFPDDAGTGAAWQWGRGHCVDVKSDNWTWQALEDPRVFATTAERRFVLIRFPGVSVARISKYLAQHTTIDQFTGKVVIVRQRLWQIAWPSLPAAARTIAINTGVLTIGSVAQGGDFTWAQVQAFFVRLDTGAGDTADLSG